MECIMEELHIHRGDRAASSSSRMGPARTANGLAIGRPNSEILTACCPQASDIAYVCVVRDSVTFQAGPRAKGVVNGRPPLM